MSNGNGRRGVIMVQGPPGPPGPAGISGVNFNIATTSLLQYTQGTNIQTINTDIIRDLDVKLGVIESEVVTIRGKDSILVNGNLVTAINYALFVLYNNNNGSFREENFNALTNSEYEGVINRLKVFLYDHARIRFECMNTKGIFKWNFDMSSIDAKYDSIYINPFERKVANFNIPETLTQGINQIDGINGYVPANDIFIRLPLLKNTAIGEVYNFYIIRKFCNVYDELNNNVCSHSEYDCDCIVGSDTIPKSYRALKSQRSSNIYIFATHLDNNDQDTVCEELLCSPLVGPRVLHTSDNKWYYLKLDSEKICNDKCFNRCSRFNLNPGSMSDNYHIQIKVVPDPMNFSRKSFLVTTPLPELDYVYTTPDTYNLGSCSDGMIIQGSQNIFQSVTKNCNIIGSQN